MRMKLDVRWQIGLFITLYCRQKKNLRTIVRKNIKKDFSPGIVAIGHSMGARLLSQAIFSKEYIKPELRNSSSESHVDLFIGLQGAFSAKKVC